MDVEKLLLKIYSGKQPSEAELEEVLRLLSSVDASSLVGSGMVDDVYSGILVIGRGRLFDHGHLVAKFLDSTDTITVSLVLETLCLEWGIYDEYLERLIDFSLGASWDIDEDVRQTAFKILGEFLCLRFCEMADSNTKWSRVRLGRIKKVGELLLSVVDDPEASDEARTSAYRACRRALAAAKSDLPGDGETLMLTAEHLSEIQPLRLRLGRAPFDSATVSTSSEKDDSEFSPKEPVKSSPADKSVRSKPSGAS